MADYVCPICGAGYKEEERRKGWAEKDPCKADYYADEDFIDLYCHHLNLRFYLHKDIYYMTDDALREKLLNLIVEHLAHDNLCPVDGANRLWYFYLNDNGDGIYREYPNYVNLSKPLSNYPTQAIDIAHRTLINYSLRYPHFGDTICPSWQEKRLSFEHGYNNNHSCGVMKLLLDLGYVKDPDNNECYVITAAGWQKIDELRKEEQSVRQGFIAMSFRDEIRPIREAFRKAIKSPVIPLRSLARKNTTIKLHRKSFMRLNAANSLLWMLHTPITAPTTKQAMHRLWESK